MEMVDHRLELVEKELGKLTETISVLGTTVAELINRFEEQLFQILTSVGEIVKANVELLRTMEEAKIS